MPIANNEQFRAEIDRRLDPDRQPQLCIEVDGCAQCPLDCIERTAEYICEEYQEDEKEKTKNGNL